MTFEVRSGIHSRIKSPGDDIDDGSRRLGKRTWFLLLTTIVLSMIACYQYGVFNVDWSWRSPKKAEVIIAEAAEPVIPDLRASQPQLTPELAVVPKATPAVTPAPIRTEKVYVVQPGDVLSRTFPKDWQAVCETNSLKNCGLIYAGQELKLPGTVEANQVVRKPVVRLADGSLPIARLNVAPYRSYTSAEKDRQILESQGYTSDEIVEYFGLVSSGGCVAETFGKGTRFPWMSFGNAKVVKNLVAVWHEPEVGKVCQLSSGRNVVVLEKCGNLTEVPSRPVAETPPPEAEVPFPIPPEEETPPPISLVPFEPAQAAARCELQAGVGVYQNRVYQGAWGYGEGHCYLNEDGEWQYGPGGYVMAGKGHNHVFHHEELGIGPQFVAQRNWVNERGHKTTLDFKARLLYDWMKGQNPSSGYWMEQHGLKIGTHLGYTERVNGGANFVGGTLELWKSLGRVDSSWSGQQVQDRGSESISAFYEHPLTKDKKWRARWVGTLKHTNWDKQNWFGLTLPEFRYDDWLMFGLQVTFPIGSLSDSYKNLSRNDITSVGAFARVEFRKQVKAADADHREGQLEFVPIKEVVPADSEQALSKSGAVTMPLSGALAEAPPREAVAPAE